MNLENIRRRIDEIDSDLVTLLNERIRNALEIGKLKTQGDHEIYVPMREREVLDRVLSLNEGPITETSIRAIYREIMSAAISLERDVAIAYLGPDATFTHQAARSRFGASVSYVPCQAVSEVFESVLKRTADYGVVAIENSIEGAVSATLDQLTTTPLHIYSEICLPVDHHLMSESRLEAVDKVYSHPIVFGQVRNWLAEHLPHAELIPASSTARAAELAAGIEGAAAVASALAADMHRVPIQARSIQDQAGNATRFLVVARGQADPTGSDKTSVVFKVRHQVGALYDALATFRSAGLNMTKIESRPDRRRAWEYWFFIDFEGHRDDPGVAQALKDLEGHCVTLSVLGSYPVATLTQPEH